MNKISLSSQCTGCSACKSACFQDCIIMKQNEEGFIVSELNDSKCTGCKQCIDKCPQLNEADLREPLNIYGMKNINLSRRRGSSSGGVFIELAERVLENPKSIVFGCTLCDLKAKHIHVEAGKKLNLLKGSKYIQSNTDGIFCEVKNYLDKGYQVLFSGTPCQVGGLKSLLGEKSEGLTTVDLICHGVPSPLLFKKYVDWVEKKYKGKIIRYDFRNKENSKFSRLIKIQLKRREKVKSTMIDPRIDPYFKAFLNNETLSESCYKCRYRNRKRIGDITLGDFWGLKKLYPEFYDNNGISLVLLNTEKGKRLIRSVISKFDFVESDYASALSLNRSLEETSIRPTARDLAYKGIQNEHFNIFEGSFYRMKKVDRLKGILKFHIIKILPSNFVDYVRAYKRR